MKQKILFLSRDPGGTNQLVALRDILSGQDSKARTALFELLDLSHTPDITLIAKDYAKAIWQQNDVACGDWPDIESHADIADYLADLCPDQIITSTSHLDDRTEQAVWRAAKTLGITTTSFLDSSDNITLRFMDSRGDITLPDQVSMINDNARKSLAALGFPAQAMFVSGDLYEDYAKSKAITQGRLFSAWGAKDGECLILFASDYISEMQALGATFDVTEFDSLNCLIDLLKSGGISEYAQGISPPYRLIIRPHPKDTPGKYDDYPQKSCENLTILINNMSSSLDAVLSAKLVAGLGSSLMNEAKILGVDVLKLDPIVKSRKGS